MYIDPLVIAILCGPFGLAIYFWKFTLVLIVLAFIFFGVIQPILLWLIDIYNKVLMFTKAREFAVIVKTIFKRFEPTLDKGFRYFMAIMTAFSGGIAIYTVYAG